jgi:hypothetical protein
VERAELVATLVRDAIREFAQDHGVIPKLAARS